MGRAKPPSLPALCFLQHESGAGDKLKKKLQSVVGPKHYGASAVSDAGAAPHLTVCICRWLRGELAKATMEPPPA